MTLSPVIGLTESRRPGYGESTLTGRYTLMARSGTATRSRILQAANRLFYAEGIRAVSVDAVAEKAGVTKKTLYYHFQSKDDLVTEYLKSRDQPNMDAFRKWFDEADGGFGDKVFAIFEGVARASKRPSWRGCGFLRTAGELANRARSSGHQGGDCPQEAI